MAKYLLVLPFHNCFIIFFAVYAVPQDVNVNLQLSAIDSISLFFVLRSSIEYLKLVLLCYIYALSLTI